MRAIFFPKDVIHDRRFGMNFCVICMDSCSRNDRCPCCKVPMRDNELIAA